MRRSSRMNDEAVRRLIGTIREGDRESDLAGRYTAIGKELGARGYSFPPLICFGANGAEPHHDTDDTALREGDMIILDVGLNADGYMSDMTRTVVLGKATSEQREVYELVKAANEAGRKIAAPGVPLCEIDRAARAVIEKGGYGKYFIHRTGHGIGLEVHEGADVSASSKAVAKEGMIFSVEPGIYLPNKFGVRIEDLVLITADGSETLNALPRDLIEL
jgi:Xaa-Pro dipeptidase